MRKMPAIEMLNVDALRPAENNMRSHSKPQVKKLADSIKEFGFTNPILIDADNEVIAGHGRLEAAKRLKLTEVPCIRLAHLTPEQKRAYLIADNRLGEIGGEWDEAALKRELAALQQVDGLDLGLIGFDAKELDRMLASLDARPTDQEADLDEAYQTYLTNTIRQIVLLYEGESYNTMVERLNMAGTAFETETTSETVIKLLDFWEMYKAETAP